jgi:glucose-1-phosphate cytidylyltransferase
MTMTAIQPTGRFGALEISNDTVKKFVEKPAGDGSWINGGFMVCEASIFDLIENDETIFEQLPLQTLSSISELNAFKHKGFWQCMDTLRDKFVLNDLWEKNVAPWKVW